jgi:hypothetical protein
MLAAHWQAVWPPLKQLGFSRGGGGPRGVMVAAAARQRAAGAAAGGLEARVRRMAAAQGRSARCGAGGAPDVQAGGGDEACAKVLGVTVDGRTQYHGQLHTSCTWIWYSKTNGLLGSLHGVWAGAGSTCWLLSCQRKSRILWCWCLNRSTCRGEDAPSAP